MDLLHVMLYDEILRAVVCNDHSLCQVIRKGFPIVAEIQRSGRWPPYSKQQTPAQAHEAEARAWELRAEDLSSVQCSCSF